MILFTFLSIGADLLLRNDRHWDRKCVGIEATTAFNQLTATAGSLPKVARVDLAAIVLNRRKLKAANILFGMLYTCSGLISY